MSVSENKAIFRRIVEVFNARNFQALDDLLAPAFVDHNLGPTQRPGIQGIKDAWVQFTTTYPDVKLRLEDIVAEDDKLATRVTLTSPKLVLNRMEFFRVADGKLVELWGITRREKVGSGQDP